MARPSLAPMLRIALILVLFALPARAREVDLQLFLAVDVSRSMSPAELELQRRGYAEALRSDEVVSAIGKGMLGRIAATYVEWAGTGSVRVIAPWTEIASRADAEAFAARLTARFDAGLRRTSISGAIDFAARSIAENGFESWRRVIDVSGDGPNNQGRPVTDARDAALAEGLVINGLPLMTRDGDDGWWSIDRLDIYYEACVIGGPGAFVIPVTDWSQFPAAVRRKIAQEIAGLAPKASPAQFVSEEPAPYDCMIGERLWKQRSYFWDNI